MNARETIQQYFAESHKTGSDGIRYPFLQGSLSSSEAFELSNIVNRFKPAKALEIGTGFGASAVAIAASMRDIECGSLCTLDPFQDQFGNIGVAEIQRLGLAKQARFHGVYAEDYLLNALKEKSCFDMVFQDGAHSIGPKMTHIYLCSKLLSPGGVLVLHDAFKPCTAACVLYLAKQEGWPLIELSADSNAKRLLRSIKYGLKYGCYYGTKVVPKTHLNLIALRKPENS
jgi:predicted O-methyltransferase YrrM